MSDPSYVPPPPGGDIGAVDAAVVTSQPQPMDRTIWAAWKFARVRRSKYEPGLQGARERMRRIRQMWTLNQTKELA